MPCAVHPEAEASITCPLCERGACDACATYEVDGRVCCERCGEAEDARSRGLGVAVVALVGVGYLATLAIGVLLFRARPFIGGLAAIVAIGLGRTLQLAMRPPVVVRRARAR